MIDEWKNPQNDPFFFVKLDHIDSYKPPEYCSNQGCSLLVLACDFFPSICDFVFLRFFPLVLSKSLSNRIILLILAQVPSISSSKGMEGVRACFGTGYGPIHSNMSVCLHRDLSFMLLFRDIIFNQPLLYPLNPAYRRKPLLSRKHLQVVGCSYLFFWWRNKMFSTNWSIFTYFYW